MDQIRQFVFCINEDDPDVPICVFKVPNSLRASNPEAYIPQIVGLGVLHHSRAETEAMQMYKLKVATNVHGGFKSIQFLELLMGVEKLVPYIRASYQTYLPQDPGEITFVMAIDGLFLFKLLCSYGIRKDALASSEFLRRLADPGDVRLQQDGILRDTMMLECQIPILVLKTILFMECSETRTIVKEYLPQLLLGYCKALSPLKVLEKYPNSAALKHAHLLDLLYHLIVLKEPPEEEPVLEVVLEQVAEGPQRRSDLPGEAVNLLASLALPQGIRKPIELLQGLLNLPWSSLDILSSSTGNTAPVVEERLVPTASNLCFVGVKFFSVERISAIGFDCATTSLKLPNIKLSVNSEVILRNLVAFEVMSIPESKPLIFTRYFELMNGIIKTAKDVAVLKKHGIIETDQSIENDDQVAKIFGGSKLPAAVRSANAPDLDKLIKDVNSYYNGLRRVKAYKFINKCGFTLWRVGKVVVIILLFSLLALQATCSVYGGCPRIFRNNN
ncbi:putative UPF0481 protein At3g02645 [Corylus avellana]|uniref:putative UPF0481 protein At3g02645 n=1 Tax=Corylus avellana TaxID=13451 RepID=UPI00286AF549|nr:putative UPF0481 protein At3g02645 [Corylus avellana]